MFPIAAEIAQDTDAIVEERDELRRKLDQQILVESVPVMEEDSQRFKLSKKSICFFLMGAAIVVGGAIGLGIALSNKQDESPAPTYSPTLTANPSPGPSNSLAPSKNPSAGPTNFPVPSMNPSPVPSQAPSTSAHPTLDGCILDVEIECRVNDNLFTSCDQHIPFQECNSLPSQMTFRYTGLNCSTYLFFFVGRKEYVCEDFFGGPLGHVGEVYITAFDSRTGNEYYEGLVGVNGTFVAKPSDGIMREEMNITVYDPRNLTTREDIVSPENLLQTLKFDDTCASAILLNELLGTMQLVGFANPMQGRITTFVPIKIFFTISIPQFSFGRDEARLSEHSLLTNAFGDEFGFLNNTDKVNGQIISEGEPLVVSQEFVVDMSKYIRYTFFTVIIAETLQGDNQCNGDAFYEVVMGWPSDGSHRE
jgi:hypothetical protein